MHLSWNLSSKKYVVIFSGKSFQVCMPPNPWSLKIYLATENECDIDVFPLDKIPVNSNIKKPNTNFSFHVSTNSEKTQHPFLQ